MAEQAHAETGTTAADENARARAAKESAIRRAVEQGHDEKAVRETADIIMRHMPGFECLASEEPQAPKAEARPNVAVSPAGSYTPSKLYPADIGNLLPKFAAVRALDEESAQRMADTASQAAEVVLRGLSGLGGVLWAAATYAGDQGEPLCNHELANAAQLISHLARAASDLQALESHCRDRNLFGAP